jgi:hypothetical protein
MGNRRARTRRLIEYGGLVVKAGLAELLEDVRRAMARGLKPDLAAGPGA